MFNIIQETEYAGYKVYLVNVKNNISFDVVDFCKFLGIDDKITSYSSIRTHVFSLKYEDLLVTVLIPKKFVE